MTERTFHRGAVVSKPLTFKGARIVWDIVQRTSFHWERRIDLNGIGFGTFAACSNAARQRHKKPITRYGVPR